MGGEARLRFRGTAVFHAIINYGFLHQLLPTRCRESRVFESPVRCFLQRLRQVSPGYNAVILFTSRFIDGLTDPIGGYLFSRCSFRWGKMRPWYAFETNAAVNLISCCFDSCRLGFCFRLLALQSAISASGGYRTYPKAANSATISFFIHYFGRS